MDKVEFLVYNKENWMDSLTQEQIDEHIAKNPKFMEEKYNIRDQKGDIIEVRPGGYWTDGKRKGFGSHAFALVTILGLSYEDARHYQDSYVDDLYKRDKKTLKRHRYQIDMTQISLDAEKKATFTNTSNAHLIDKSI